MSISSIRFVGTCVDDDLSILRSLGRMLPRQNYLVFTAESGAKGLDIMAIEIIDLVISDMRMPNMSGAEFLQKKWWVNLMIQ